MDTRNVIDKKRWSRYKKGARAGTPAFLASAAGTLSLQDAIIGTEISKPYNHLENLRTNR